MASLANNLAAAIAFNRFGLGGRPADAIPASPASWLIGQLAGPDPVTDAGLPSTATGLAMLATLQQVKGTAGTQAITAQIIHLRDAEIAAFLDNALNTSMPFRERLVWFWANHFALMAQGTSVASCAGAYVREAIRPHVNGTFKDMLLAVMQHPAMLISLNNNFSAGPDSVSGRLCQATGCSTVGINENLARECLELHTLGVNGGYTQADVDALAMLITGWSVNTGTAPQGFLFNMHLHEPVAQTLLGTVYPPTLQGGIDALTMLATSPVTYQHLATQLVAHFVSDTPAAADVATIAGVLMSTGGNLAAASSALVNLPSAWQPYTKIRTPMDYVISVLRGLGVTRAGTASAMIPAYVLNTMGCPVWQPPFPNGYGDTAADWVSPAQVMVRNDWISTMTAALPATDPVAIASSALGPLLQQSTLAAMAAASLPQDKLSLLFLSPEFQRR